MVISNTKLCEMNEVVRKTIESISEGRQQIFEIAEECRNEYNHLNQKLNELKQKVKEIIEEIEYLELLERKSRYNLMKVSKNFNHYSENEIRKAYETAKNLQIKLILKREQEKLLLDQRTEVERQIKRVKDTIERAEQLISRVSSAISYLNIALINIDDAKAEFHQKEEMGIRIIMAQEEERRRVAMDIHDGPAQSLSNLILKCEICEKLIDLDIKKAKEGIRELKQLVRLSLKEVRKIIFDLRPMSLDDLGLIHTLERYIENFMAETKIEVVLDLYSKTYKLDSIVEVAVFRIIQEALNNIQKYANATQVWINLKIKNDVLLATIMDNGVGFDVNDVLNNRKPDRNSGGFGLYGMKQRAELLNGRLKVQSQLNQGTIIRLEIPLGSPPKEEFYG